MRVIVHIDNRYCLEIGSVFDTPTESHFRSIVSKNFYSISKKIDY